jgi:orotate phosphoribosyltransferase
MDFVTDNEIEVDTFYGVPEGATKLGVITQYHWAQTQKNYAKGSHVLAMGRVKPKKHGDPKDRYFVGMPRGKVLVLEDTTTTAGSALASVEKLLDSGIDVCGLLILSDRMEKRDDGLSVKEAVEQIGISFYCMSTALELLPIMYKRLKPGETIGRAVEAEFDQYGVGRVSLLE